LVIYNRNILFP